jgi:hypothetical protein
MKTTVIFGIFTFILWLAAIIGWVSCIYKAANCNWDPIGKAEIVYTVGACTPLGAIIGYINIKDN